MSVPGVIRIHRRLSAFIGGHLFFHVPRARECARLSPFGAFLLRSAHCLLFFVASCAPAGQPFTPGDWWDFRDISAPRINAEGTSVVYVESWNLRDGDRACSNLWTVSATGGGGAGPRPGPARRGAAPPPARGRG